MGRRTEKKRRTDERGTSATRRRLQKRNGKYGQGSVKEAAAQSRGTLQQPIQQRQSTPGTNKRKGVTGGRIK